MDAPVTRDELRAALEEAAVDAELGTLAGIDREIVPPEEVEAFRRQLAEPPRPLTPELLLDLIELCKAKTAAAIKRGPEPILLPACHACGAPVVRYAEGLYDFGGGRHRCE